MKSLSLIIVLVISAINTAICCTCYPPYYTNFMEAANHSVFKDNNSLIVLAQIQDFSMNNYFMEVHLIDEIKGSVGNNKIIIAGQDGMNCALPFKQASFNKSDTLILRLIPDFYSRSDTLEVNDCSLNYLKYSNNYVHGNITPTDTLMKYSEFKSLIIEDNVTSIYQNYYLEPEPLILYPNPSDGFIRISVNNAIRYDIYIYDLAGRLVKKIFNFSGGYIDMSDLASGNYIIKFSPDMEGQWDMQRVVIRQ